MWQKFQDYMYHGGTCALVSVYIVLQAAIFASLLKWVFEVPYSFEFVMPLAILIIIAQYFERPMIGDGPKKRNDNFYRFMLGSKLLLAESVLSPSIWQMPERQGELPKWHPLERVVCGHCMPKHRPTAYRPPRARHCVDCGTCRIAWDHHCTFVNACIDETNYPAFYCFLIWSFCGLALSKILDLYMLVIFVMLRHPPATADDIHTFEMFTSWLPANALKNIADLQGMPKVLLIANGILGCLVAAFILSLWVQQTINTLLNTTSSEYTKYAKLGVRAPYNAMNASHYRIWRQWYTNIAHRVWRGPLYNGNGPIKSFDATPMPLVQWLIEIGHVFACYTIPGYWNFSGEFTCHTSAKMMAKHGTLPAESLWMDHAAAHGLLMPAS